MCVESDVWNQLRGGGKFFGSIFFLIDNLQKKTVQTSFSGRANSAQQNLFILVYQSYGKYMACVWMGDPLFNELWIQPRRFCRRVLVALAAELYLKGKVGGR